MIGNRAIDDSSPRINDLRSLFSKPRGTARESPVRPPLAQAGAAKSLILKGTLHVTLGPIRDICRYHRTYGV